MGEVEKSLEIGRVRFVDAQVAVAIDILLAIPLRPQNLSCLHWQNHFSEPNGSGGKLILHIPAGDTKTKRQEIVAELPYDVARRLRCYRRHVLPRLGADVNGYLFVTEQGSKKSQATLSQQIIEAIARHIGIHMTPHQFRHFGATSYLEQHPEDFETARAILGHAWGKTTRIYAGSSSRRASQAYNEFLFKQREELKLMRRAQEAGAVTHANAEAFAGERWPEADHEAFKAVYEPGDVFDETAGPGAHLAEGTRRMIETTYRRWLGFLKANYPGDLFMPPADRITRASARLHQPSEHGDTGQLRRHRRS